jgi:hypothetical protein
VPKPLCPLDFGAHTPYSPLSPVAQVREVDAELEAYHRSNAELDALIGRLRTSLDELQVSGEIES